MKMNGCNRFCKGAILVFIALAPCIQAVAQKSSAEKFKEVLRCTADFVDYVLNDVDTMFVEKNLYNLTFRPDYSYSYEHYNFTGKSQSLDIAPKGINALTFNIGWRWLIVGYSIDLQKGRELKEFNTSLYSARFGLDLYYRKSSDGYRIKRLYNEGQQLPYTGNGENALTVKQIGAGLCYAFNKRFSYAAAYGQSTIQRVSAGSLILGAGYNRQAFTLNHEAFDPLVKTQPDDALWFRNIKFNDFNISAGYAYNWVFAKNLLAGVSFAPAISYKRCETAYDERGSVDGCINMDFTTRAAVVYNNNRYYAGVSLESHTYGYKKSNLQITDGFGVLELYTGFNFWRRKK